MIHARNFRCVSPLHVWSATQVQHNTPRSAIIIQLTHLVHSTSSMLTLRSHFIYTLIYTYTIQPSKLEISHWKWTATLHGSQYKPPFTWTFGGSCATLTARPKDPWNEELFRTTNDPGGLSFSSWIATQSQTVQQLMTHRHTHTHAHTWTHTHSTEENTASSWIRNSVQTIPSSLEIFGRCHSCDVSRTNRGVCSESSPPSARTTHHRHNLTHHKTYTQL